MKERKMDEIFAPVNKILDSIAENQSSDLLEVSDQAEDEKPYLRQTVVNLLQDQIKNFRMILMLECFLIASGMCLIYGPYLANSFDSMLLIIFWSFVGGGVSSIGLLNLIVDWKTRRIYDERLFIKRIVWVNIEMKK